MEQFPSSVNFVVLCQPLKTRIHLGQILFHSPITTPPKLRLWFRPSITIPKGTGKSTCKPNSSSESSPIYRIAPSGSYKSRLSLRIKIKSSGYRADASFCVIRRFSSIFLYTEIPFFDGNGIPPRPSTSPLNTFLLYAKFPRESRQKKQNAAIVDHLTKMSHFRDFLPHSPRSVVY